MSLQEKLAQLWKVQQEVVKLEDEVYDLLEKEYTSNEDLEEVTEVILNNIANFESEQVPLNMLTAFHSAKVSKKRGKHGHHGKRNKGDNTNESEVTEA